MLMRCRAALPGWSACVLGFLAGCLPGSGHAQTTPAGNAIFRANTQEVLVDAIVTDRKGNFQAGLTRQDFKILEDGKEQPITSFVLEGADSHRPVKHFVALVFELEHPGLREQVIQFVDRFASPDLYIAVFSRVGGEMRLQQAFTTDAARIKAAVAAMQIVPPTPTQLDILGRPGKSPSHFDRISQVVAAIAPAQGRKALVLFTYEMAGWLMDRDFQASHPWMMGVEVQKSIDECNAAGISVYSFAGLHGDVTANRTAAEMSEPDSRPHAVPVGSGSLVRDLAEYTGGKFTPYGVYDMASYLGDMSTEQNIYYLLGYAPTGASADKPCHKLTVKVAGAGLKVQNRESYCSSIPVSKALTSAQQALEARAIGNAAATIQGGMQLSWFYSKPNTAAVHIAMDLDPAVFRFRGLHGEFNVSGAAYRPDGSVAARIGDTVRIEFDARAQLDAFLKSPYHYSKQLDLSPGQYRVRIAFGSAEQAFGRAEGALEIEPWDGKALSASAIALAAQDRPLTDATAELASWLREGPHRLASKGREIIPMGGATFASGTDGLIYLEIYDPDLSQETASQPVTTPAIRIRIVNRATAREVESSLTDAGPWIRFGDPVIPIALSVPVARLPPGGYTLEAQVSRANGKAAVIRHVEFDVR